MTTYLITEGVEKEMELNPNIRIISFGISSIFPDNMLGVPSPIYKMKQYSMTIEVASGEGWHKMYLYESDTFTITNKRQEFTA